MSLIQNIFASSQQKECTAVSDSGNHNQKLSNWGVKQNRSIKDVALQAITDEHALLQILEWIKKNRTTANIAGWLGNPADSEEVEQRTLIKVKEKITQYNGLGTFEGWVASIARREALQLNRKQKQKSTPISHPEPERLNKRSAQFSSAVANKALIDEAILELTPQQDLVFQMRLDGFSHIEIGTILGVTASASASTQASARKKIATKIRNNDPDFNPTILDLRE